MNISVINGNETYKGFITALPEATFVISSDDGNILAVNQAAQAYLGDISYTGQALQTFLHNPPRQLQNCLKYCARTRNPMPITLSFANNPTEKQAYEAILIEPSQAQQAAIIMLRCKAEEDNPFVALNRQIDKHKQTSHALQALEKSQAALRNVTEQLQSRNATLETINQQLQHEIEQRQLAEQAMKNAKLEAEQANQVKTTFLANVSHELRTPLNAIFGYTHLLQQHSTPEKHDEYTHNIQQHGEYLLTLINDILDVSKLEAGNVKLQLHDFSIETLLHNLSDLFATRAHAKGLTFVYEATTPLPVGLHGDEKRLRQIIINLLSNAVKFTEQGGVVLKVGYADSQLTLSVTDTGIGIDSNELSAIFLPFEQLSDYLGKHTGTGLGLAITQNLLKLMAGQLEVTSTPQQGSTFRITLPLPPAHGELRTVVRNTPAIIGYRGAKRRILLVENKAASRQLLTDMLQPLGFIIHTADNGQQGLAEAQRLQPDLIITELVLPCCDGFRMVQQLRQQPPLHPLRIIGLSAGLPIDAPALHEYPGFDGLIRTPIDRADLLALLANLLELSWTYQTQTPTPPATTASPSLFEHLLIAPSAASVKDLLQLAMYGDICGIKQYVDRLDCHIDTCPASAFCKRIRELADRFDEQRICELLERCAASLQSLPADDSAAQQSTAVPLLMANVKKIPKLD